MYWPGVSVPTSDSPFGNAQRNMVVGPAFYQTDLGLHKDFGLWSEVSRLEFRVEAFNVSNGTFGSVTGAYPARHLQLAAKLILQVGKLGTALERLRRRLYEVEPLSVSEPLASQPIDEEKMVFSSA